MKPSRKEYLSERAKQRITCPHCNKELNKSSIYYHNNSTICQKKIEVNYMKRQFE